MCYRRMMEKISWTGCVINEEVLFLGEPFLLCCT